MGREITVRPPSVLKKSINVAKAETHVLQVSPSIIIIIIRNHPVIRRRIDHRIERERYPIYIYSLWNRPLLSSNNKNIDDDKHSVLWIHLEAERDSKRETMDRTMPQQQQQQQDESHLVLGIPTTMTRTTNSKRSKLSCRRGPLFLLWLLLVCWMDWQSSTMAFVLQPNTAATTRQQQRQQQQQVWENDSLLGKRTRSPFQSPPRQQRPWLVVVGGRLQATTSSSSKTSTPLTSTNTTTTTANVTTTANSTVTAKQKNPKHSKPKGNKSKSPKPFNQETTTKSSETVLDQTSTTSTADTLDQNATTTTLDSQNESLEQEDDGSRDDSTANTTTTVDNTNQLDPHEEEEEEEEDSDDDKVPTEAMDDEPTNGAVEELVEPSALEQVEDDDEDDQERDEPTELENENDSTTTTTTASTTTTTTNAAFPAIVDAQVEAKKVHPLLDPYFMGSPPSPPWSPPDSSGKRTTTSSGPDPTTAPALDLDEYDVILLYPTPQSPLHLMETVDGHVAFGGYVLPEQPCSTIRNVGDVLLSIDGVSTEGCTLNQIQAWLTDQARRQPYSFCRFRSVVLPTTVLSPTTGELAGATGGHLPGERQRYVLEQELVWLGHQVEETQQQLQHLQTTIHTKKQELKRLRLADLEWMERKSGELEYQI